ncbi:phosphatase PAP2 family protein [Candidatus Gottesmanbacteria bacterium]|nr:phosphatase PAP2 family protein [Candidatus Gottesmanbacteria bacterium]
MGEFIFALDYGIINFIQGNFINPPFTLFFRFLSGVGTWGVIWVVIAGILLLFEEIEDKKIFDALIVAFFGSITGGEFLLKNLFQRLRPEASFLQTYSFPSTHATLAFAGAYILSQKHKKYSYLYYTIAFLIAFSRIYLGEHYPSDVIGGVLLGLAVGWLSLFIINYTAPINGNKPFAFKFGKGWRRKFHFVLKWFKVHDNLQK